MDLFLSLTDTLLEKTLLLLAATILVTYLSYIYALAQGWASRLHGKYVWLLLLLPFALLFGVLLLPFPYSLIWLMLFWAFFWVELVLILPHYQADTVKNALSLTGLLTLGVGYFWFTTQNDLWYLYPILFGLLIVLIIWNVVVLWRRSEGRTGRMVRSIFGALIFTIYIVVDMNRLAQVWEFAGSGMDAASRQLATQFAISIYIDMINLFLYILQIMWSGN